MTGDFNIRDSFWDSNFSYYSSHRDTLFEVTDFFGLELLKPVKFFPTRYSDDHQDLDSVLDLVFLCPNSSEHDHHYILTGGSLWTMFLLLSTSLLSRNTFKQKNNL